MAQYLDEQGLHYMVDKLNAKVQLVSEDYDLSELGAEEFCAVRKRLPAEEYFNLTALAAGDITITIPSYVTLAAVTSISYSKDKTNWTTPSIVAGQDVTITIPMLAGETVYIKGDASQYAAAVNQNRATKINSTVNIVAAGNTMSLLYGDNFKDKTTLNPYNSTYGIFTALFYQNTHLINASDLILPALTLTNYAYYQMFYGCSNLIGAPELPATSLGTRCYSMMFQDCTSLTKAPTKITSTTALSGGERNFLAMFYGCTSLVKGPTIDVISMGNYVAQNMFAGCTSLTSVTLLITESPSATAVSGWLTGAASTGTLTIPTGITMPTGTVPTGWTIVEV